MKIVRDWERCRKGVAGIVAALIMFVMIFTVGTGYFLWVSTNNSIYSKAEATNVQANQLKQNENILVTTSCCSSGNLSFTAQNVGGVPVSIVAVYVNDASGNIFVKNNFKTLNQGTVTALPLPTDCNPATTCNISSASVSLLTQRGSIFSGTYPPTNLNTVVGGLVSAAIGDIQISFPTFTYYNVTNSGCPTPAPPDPSGYCFSKIPGASAFTIKASVAYPGPIAFSINVTNFGSSKSTIKLDPYTFMEQFAGVGSSGRNTGFFIMSTSSRTILSHYTPVLLPYNKTVTLFFGAGFCVLITSNPNNPSASCQTFTPSPFSSASGGHPAAGQIWFTSIFTHGWKALAVPPYKIGSTNYGQNIPFVTVLYD